MSTTAQSESVVMRVEGWWTFIDAMATRYQVRQSLVEAVIHQESGGDPDAFRVEAAVNDASFGLMQVLLGTAHALGYRGTPRGLFLPMLNIDLGTHYLHDLQFLYRDPLFVLLHYNGGGKAVARWEAGDHGFPAETYATNVLALAAFYRERNLARVREAP